MTGSDHCLSPEKPSGRSAASMAQTPRRLSFASRIRTLVGREASNESVQRWLTRSKSLAACYPQEFPNRSAFRLDAAERLQVQPAAVVPMNRQARESFGSTFSNAALTRRKAATRRSMKERKAGSPVGGELSRSCLTRQCIEHSVDHAALLGAEESGGDVDIFGHRHARRHVRAVAQFVKRRAQDGAHKRFGPPQRPAFGERVVEAAVDRQLIV